MIKLIVGKKGFGKTKILVDMINTSAKKSSGNIVCIEKEQKLTYDIDHSVRLVDVENYAITGADTFYGTLAGLLAGNYDITEIYVDSILKVIGNDLDELGKLLDKVDKLAGESVLVVFTVSADLSELPESVKKYV